MDSGSVSIESETLFEVYRGVWTNWSRGPILGVTLTLSKDDGNLLIGFVAFFVTIIGTRFWRIICFIVHTISSSEKPQGGLYHQRQAMLRNAGTALSAIVYLINFTWAWRQTSKQHYCRTIPIIVCTVLYACAFTIASGYSSKVATSLGNEVLLSGSHCSFLDYNVSTKEQWQLSYSSSAKIIEAASNYAQQCYSMGSSCSMDYSAYIKNRLPTSVRRNASCPFHTELCRSSNSNILLDTGLLDSNDNFGLNTPPNERFLFRRVFHCAPLATEGYKTNHTVSPHRSYTQYHYGPFYPNSFTYQYSKDGLYELKLLNNSGGDPDYTIGVIEARNQNVTLGRVSNWDPLPGLYRQDADVTLYFLSAGQVMFNERTTDEWYKATRQVGEASQLESGVVTQLYRQNEPASPLGCILQEQYCNSSLPEEKRCSTPMGHLDALDSATALFPDGSARRRMDWIQKAIFGQNNTLPNSVVHALGTRSLTSKFSLTSGLQGHLPEHQWQLEVENWHNIGLSLLQKGFLRTAKGISDSKLSSIAQWPWNAESIKLCNNQKIRSTAYVSFSFLGLVFIFVLGGLIVVVSFILEPLANFIHRRCRKAESYALIEWSTNETLQLQRLAHEELGLGTWSRAMESVPITEADEVLGLLDLADPDHPRLQKPPHEEKPDGNALAAEGEHPSGDDDGKKDSISTDEVHVSLQEESEVSDHPSSSMTGNCSGASPQVEISPYEAAFLWDLVAEGGSTVQRDVRP